MAPPDWDGAPDIEGGTVTVEFTEVDGNTRVRLTHTGLTPEISPHVKGGWSAAFEKLDRFLATAA